MSDFDFLFFLIHRYAQEGEDEEKLSNLPQELNPLCESLAEIIESMVSGLFF